MERRRTHPNFKVWLETDEGYAFGPGVYSILREIRCKGTLRGAASSLGMSYRFAWGMIRKAEERLGAPLVESHKGGSAGGGGARLTSLGEQFVDQYASLERRMGRLSNAETFWGVVEEIKDGGRRLVVYLDAPVKSLSVGKNLEITPRPESED
jgi:molybdate transport repressor ModE-like protein